MKKVTKLFSAIFIAMMFTGCAKKEKEVAIVKPEKSSVYGDLSSYVEVIDNDYEVVEKWGGNLSIKLKAVKAFDGDLGNKDIKLTASMLGSNSMPVSGTGDFRIEYSSKSKLISLLENGTGEEVIQLKANLGDYKADEHSDKIKTFSVSSSLKDKPKRVVNETVEENKELESDVIEKANNWDNTLVTYEEYIDKYIALMKKAKDGDMSAMTEYPAMMTKANELQIQLTKASSDLTTKQIGKLTKLQMKLSKAALEMQ